MKIKIVKLKELEDAVHPNNIEEGSERVRKMPDDMFRKPEAGLMFWAGTFRSSTVQEVIDDNTFKTQNSIYHWEILPEDES